MTDAVKCGDCGEAVEWHAELGPGVRKWLHVRTGAAKCAPLCDQCGQPAKHALGFHGFDGSGSRFIRTGWRCDACVPANIIVWT